MVEKNQVKYGYTVLADHGAPTVEYGMHSDVTCV